MNHLKILLLIFWGSFTSIKAFCQSNINYCKIEDIKAFLFYNHYVKESNKDINGLISENLFKNYDYWNGATNVGSGDQILVVVEISAKNKCANDVRFTLRGPFWDEKKERWIDKEMFNQIQGIYCSSNDTKCQVAFLINSNEKLRFVGEFTFIAELVRSQKVDSKFITKLVLPGGE